MATVFLLGIGSCAETITRLLEDNGYRIISSWNEREALEIIRRAPPDVLILEHEQTEIDALEMCRRIRCTPGLDIRNRPKGCLTHIVSTLCKKTCLS